MIRASSCFDIIIIACSVIELLHCVSLVGNVVHQARPCLFLRVRDVMWLDIDDQC